MGFKSAPGIPGRVFVPEETPRAHKKHDCPDCYRCQQCSEDRCQLCRTAEACHAPPEAGAEIGCRCQGRSQAVPEG